jgi:hypothetical protein
VTRSEIEQAVYRATNKNTSSVDTATQTRIRHFINSRHRRILSMPGMEVLRRAVTTFNSVAEDSEFALAGVAAVKRVWETTNDRELEWLSIADYRALEPDPDESQGLPTYVVFMGFESDGDWLGHLYPQPSSVIAYSADVENYISDLSGDSSEPQLPDDFHFILELGATVDELRKMDDGRYKVVDEEYRAGLRDLLYRLARQRASQPVTAERSSLGAWFPADR